MPPLQRQPDDFLIFSESEPEKNDQHGFGNKREERGMFTEEVNLNCHNLGTGKSHCNDVPSIVIIT